jgi:acyl-CoA thioesterase-2
MRSLHTPLRCGGGWCTVPPLDHDDVTERGIGRARTAGFRWSIACGGMDLRHLFDLEPHGPDTWVGVGPQYPWGGLYGGQIVAQALHAAARSVDDGLAPHSLRAYFIRRGDHTEPIRFEVDRIRNGRSFATRRVVARQAIGAILNLEASFQRDEDADDVTTVPMPSGLPSPDDVTGSSWTPAFERRWVPGRYLTGPEAGARTGAGRVAAWMRVNDRLPDEQLIHRSWLAYLSDDLPTDSVGAIGLARRRRRPAGRATLDETSGRAATRRARRRDVASLDHTIWFHRPLRADEWHLHDTTCHGYTGGRGLAIGHVFSLGGVARRHGGAGGPPASRPPRTVNHMSTPPAAPGPRSGSCRAARPRPAPQRQDRQLHAEVGAARRPGSSTPSRPPAGPTGCC